MPLRGSRSRALGCPEENSTNLKIWKESITVEVMPPKLDMTERHAARFLKETYLAVSINKGTPIIVVIKVIILRRIRIKIRVLIELGLCRGFLLSPNKGTPISTQKYYDPYARPPKRYTLFWETRTYTQPNQ